jgi:hypothetical protein
MLAKEIPLETAEIRRSAREAARGTRSRCRYFSYVRISTWVETGRCGTFV